MSNITNLNRDMWWPSSVVELAPVAGAFVPTLTTVARDAAVGQFSNAVSTPVFTVTASTNFDKVGTLLLGTIAGDNVPYRVHGDYQGPNICRWVYGFDNGTNAVGCRVFGVGNYCDRVVSVPPLASGDPGFGFPICFFACVSRSVAGSSAVAIGVQRLVSSPAGFASAVS